jgi:hypothetical protein
LVSGGAALTKKVPCGPLNPLPTPSKELSRVGALAEAAPVPGVAESALGVS